MGEKFWMQLGLRLRDGNANSSGNEREKKSSSTYRKPFDTGNKVG